MAHPSTKGDQIMGTSSLIRPSEANRRLAFCALFGAVLFTLTWFVLGFLSTGYSIYGTVIPSYSPISQPISGLGLGSTGPYMNAAFILGGILMLLGVLGALRVIRMSPAARWSCTVLLALSPLGMVMVGLFTLESFFLHFTGFLLGLGTPILSFPVAGLLLRRVPGWRRFGTGLVWSGPITLFLLALFFATFDQTAAGANVGVGGLVQRLLCVEVQSWYAALGWLAFRGKRSDA